uniref:Hexosyltransferase n=1 Tax=Leersia perrieri TaxID=77586 RepID=A0A0D9WHW7_9ORYZ
MKGQPGGASPAKRRWRSVAAASAAVALLFLSVGVPLAVLLGLHQRFPSVYLADESAVSVFGGSEGGSWEPNTTTSQENDSLPVNDMDKFSLSTDKDWSKTNISSSDGESEGINIQPNIDKLVTSNTPILPGLPIQQIALFDDISLLNSMKSCQLEFGSYCVWSVEHKEVMKDSIVKRLKDQLFVARAYYPSIAKLEGMEKLSHEMKLSIQEHEHMLSDAICDADLPRFHGVNMAKMEKTISAAKSCLIECTNFEKKLRQLLDMTEDEAHFHARQGAYLYRLGVQTLPKSLHCLSMRLTVDYFKSFADMESSNVQKLENPVLRHHVIFSTNLLASSMTVNSTVINSEESANMVFHLVTDAQNFYAFKNWFVRNSYKEATVSVLNFEDFQAKHLDNRRVEHLSPSEEFRVTSNSDARVPNTRMRTEYISVHGHSLFLLPELFSNLKRVIVLEDDTIVQRDLSHIWNLDLKGKVIGAVQSCRVRLRHLRPYLADFPYDASSCIWMSGVSVIDLNNWREYDVTAIRNRLLQKLRHDTEASWRAAVLPASLLAFQNLVHPIEAQWIQSGLGHDYGVNHGAIKKAGILHYNGNMKPWLELGIPRYRKYWKKYLPRDDPFMVGCNVNP